MSHHQLFALLGLLAGIWVSRRIWKHQAQPMCPLCGGEGDNLGDGEALICTRCDWTWRP